MHEMAIDPDHLYSDPVFSAHWLAWLVLGFRTISPGYTFLKVHSGMKPNGFSETKQKIEAFTYGHLLLPTDEYMPWNTFLLLYILLFLSDSWQGK